MSSLIKQFLNHIKENNIIKKGDIVFTAFSGGKDSTALLLLLKELKNHIKFSLYAAYINHNIRKDSKKEEEHVINFCKENKIILFIKSIDVKSFIKNESLNLEYGASILRYKALKDISSFYKNSKIATAHTLTDNIETFFIKLLRGSGSEGLSSIFESKDNIIRPLLKFNQKNIIDYLKENRIKYYFDSSNNDKNFLRNKIRHELLPLLMNIEPNFETNISNYIKISTRDFIYFKKISQNYIKKNLINKSILKIKKLKKQNSAIQSYIIREYIRLIRGDLRKINHNHIESILNNLKNNTTISLPDFDLKIFKHLIFNKNILINDYEYKINTQNEIFIKEINARLIIKNINSYTKPKDNFTIIVNKKKIKYPLILRNPKKSDSYVKINSKVKIKVFEMIRESGFPYELRNLLPILLDSKGDIIQVFGSPISDKFKVKNKNEELLQVELIFNS